MKTYRLSFNDLGSDFNYKMTDLFTAAKEKVVDEVIKKKKLKKTVSFDILPVNGLDFEVYELVRSFSEQDIMSIRLDVQTMVGENQRYYTPDFLNWKETKEEEVKRKIDEIIAKQLEAGGGDDK